MKKAVIIRCDKPINFETLEEDEKKVRKLICRLIAHDKIFDFYCKYEENYNKLILFILFELKNNIKKIKIHTIIPKANDIRDCGYIISLSDSYKIL